MAELLIKAIDANHADPVKDRRGCYKRGMIVCIQPDGHAWGREERLPKFVIVKIPYVSKEKLNDYLAAGDDAAVGRRLWQLRISDIPTAAKLKLATLGELTIKAVEQYAGAYDFTWAQIRSYLRNRMTGLDETKDLTT